MDITILASTRHKNPYHYVDRIKRILHNSDTNSNANSNTTINPNINRKILITGLELASVIAMDVAVMLVNMNIAKIIRIQTKGVPVRSRITGNINMRSQICVKLKVYGNGYDDDDDDSDT